MAKKLIILGICFVGFTSAQTLNPFDIGESLHYSAKINFIPAGIAKLKIKAIETVDGFETFHISFNVKSSKIIDRLFKVRDVVETWVDTKELFTRKFRKDIRERNYKNKFSATINYEDSLITTEEREFPVSQEIRDPYSMIYYLRTVPLKVGDLFSYTTFDNNKFTVFKIIVHHKEKIKVPAGKFNCFVIEPFREGKSLLKSKGNMTIWLSDDKRRLPVKIESNASFGTMILKLKKVSVN
tara:strand:+ start:27856 stop:28575 length:720 start_codon:yes stop_codon:yes gene_type:complete